MGVYTLKILGWIVLISMFLLAIIFIALIVWDIMKKKYLPILWRTIALLFGILIYVLIKKVNYL
jgi:hypothetical protein